MTDHKALPPLHVEKEGPLVGVRPLPLIHPVLFQGGAGVAHNTQDVPHVRLIGRAEGQRLRQLCALGVLLDLRQKAQIVFVRDAELFKHVGALCHSALKLLFPPPLLHSGVVAL